MTPEAKHEMNLAALPEWAASQIRRSPVPIDHIWEGWTDDLPVALSKRAAFIASTARTIAKHGRLASKKSVEMLTDALLKYYTLPDCSDLEHKQWGVYGWTPRQQEAVA